MNTWSRRTRILALYQQGHSVREIAAALGVSTQRVYQQLRALDLPAPSRRENNHRKREESQR